MEKEREQPLYKPLSTSPTMVQLIFLQQSEGIINYLILFISFNHNSFFNFLELSVKKLMLEQIILIILIVNFGEKETHHKPSDKWSACDTT